MRMLIAILIILVVAVIAAIATGFLNISQIRGGQVPTISATGNGVTASGGQAPAFDIETGSVKVGAQPTNVQLPTPTLEVSRPGAGAASSNNAM